MGRTVPVEDSQDPMAVQGVTKFQPVLISEYASFHRTRRSAENHGETLSVFQNQHFRLRMSPRMFVLTWCCILLLHLLDAAFLVAMSVLFYWLLCTPDVTEVLLSNLKILPTSQQLALIWVFPAVAIAHLLVVVHILFVSWSHGQLRLHEASYLPLDRSPSQRAIIKRPRSLPWRKALGVLKTKALARVRVSTKPFLSVEGAYFEIAFVLREALEILFQTYQAYYMSIWITNKHINRNAVAAIVINCISSPIIHVFTRHNLALQRYLCLICDATLSFVFAVVIPLWIFFPYWKAYDPATQYFPDELMMDDVWYAKATRECQQIMIVSLTDFTSTILPHVNMLFCLWTSEELVRRKRKQISAQPSKKQIRQIRVLDRRKLVPIHTNSALVDDVKIVNARLEASRVFGRRLEWLIDVGFVLVGVAVLLCHLQAQHDVVYGCKLQADAWFTRQNPCVVLEVNCYRRNLHGTSEELDSIFESLNGESLAELIITHCPHVEMPVSMHKFRHVVGIELYNSTLVEWSQDASIGRQHLDSLNYMYFIRSNVTSTPQGILDPALPPDTFQDVEFFQTRVPPLPEDLYKLWPNVNILVMEHASLQQIPSALVNMDLKYLSLVGNHIQSIPSGLLENMAFMRLWLSDNPLQHLPVLTNWEHVFSFAAEFTNVTVGLDDLPAWQWLESDSLSVHSLYGSPFCESEQTSSSAEQPASLLETFHSAVCAENFNTSKGWYPIDFIGTRRIP